MTVCAEEDKEVDKLGEEEDKEPPELYSGDVSSAVKRRRRPGVTPSRAQSTAGQSGHQDVPYCATDGLLCLTFLEERESVDITGRIDLSTLSVAR